MTTRNGQGQFGDTTLTKVFVGGLAWETPMETLRDYFAQFGDILEAVIISDKLSGRSKGYGFVTFKEPEDAKKACEEASPIINGRRANCNLAALGARTPTPTPQHAVNNNVVGLEIKGVGKAAGGVAVVGPPPSQVQWYFPVGVPPAVSPYHHQHPQALPIYGYSPAYVAPGYNHKVGYNGGVYYPQQMYTGGAAVGHTMLGGGGLIPMYQHQQNPQGLYAHQLQLHQQQRAQAMGLPAHMIHASNASPFIPAGLISKPTLPTPVGTYGCGAVVIKAGDGLKSTS